MGLVYAPHASGLVVATQAADEASIRRALKEFDPGLMLDVDVDEQHSCYVWRVLKRVSRDQPPHPVCRWTDEHGRPLPLSHGLVEHVKNLYAGSRAPKVDVEAENDRLREKRRQEDIEEIEFYADELVKRLKGKSSAVLPRGLHRRGTAFSEVTDIR